MSLRFAAIAWAFTASDALLVGPLAPVGAASRCGVIKAQKYGDIVDPDLVSGTFVQDELSATWARAGKGRELWKPGDKTDSVALDYQLLWTTWKLNPPVLHAFDHCHLSTRCRLVLGWVGLPFKCNFHGYGAGADPNECEGFGYDPEQGGVVPLTGSKVCPVLTAAGVPTEEGKTGLDDAMQICSFAAGVAKEGRIAPATGRDDLTAWLKQAKPILEGLERPRLLRMPIPDFADAKDVEYGRWALMQDGFDLEKAEAETPALLEALKPFLGELESMLRGRDATYDNMPTLNAWGLSMDDALLLPALRSLTCVEGVTFPPLVLEYIETGCEAAGVGLFTEYAS